MRGWALDLGTTNSGVARWDEASGQPQLVELIDVCRDSERDGPLEAPRMVPSAVYLLERPRLVDRIGSWPPVARRVFLGRRALIGRPALEHNRDTVHPGFVPTFKAALASESTRPLARVGRRAVSARVLARAYLRELLAAVKRATGERIRDLVVTSPGFGQSAARGAHGSALPGVFARLERRFERRRMRAWQPFEAVAYGGACFAADRVGALDFVVHDYAFVTHDAKSGREQHTVVVTRGTRFPTAPDLWKRQLVPTCSRGEPESIFRLVICEVARADGLERKFVFDAAGDLHKVGGASGEDAVVVPLNAASPTLGYLDPPHDPRDRRPRLEIAFGVNAERWLIAAVYDLLTRKELMREEPVVRLV